MAFSFAVACLLSASALAAPAPPVITVQPTPQALALGATLNLSVTATGTLPLSYQWRLNGAAFPGATSPVFSLLNVQESLQGNYTVVVSNSGGAVTSAVAVVTILSPPLLYDLGQPQPLTAFAGTDATFTVSAIGDQPFTYQWRFGGVDIAGATNNPLVLTAVQTNQAGNYSVVVSNALGAVTSSNALLMVLDSLRIVVQPVTAAALAGETVTFLVGAAGRPALTYQWFKNAAPITGATNALLSLASVSTNDVANYNVRVSNPDGSVTSATVGLTIATRALQVVTTQSIAPTANFTAGTAISVPVALLADGGENRVRGSVAYDTNKLVFASVSTPLIGTLTFTNAATGQVGFDFALPPAQIFSPGSNAVVFLNFTLGAGVTQCITGLVLQGEPVTNQVFNAAGAPLPCYFNSGVLLLKSLAATSVQDLSGATTETLTILNPASSRGTVGSLRISFFDLGVDSLGNAIYLLNATGTNNGVPFILIPSTIAPAGTLLVSVDYFVSDRTTSPRPRIVIEMVTDGLPTRPAGTELAIDRTRFHQGRVFLDFQSTAGKTYYILYSASPVGPFDISFPGVAGTGSPLQWVDTGPPRTPSLPGTASTRYYRLLQAP